MRALLAAMMTAVVLGLLSACAPTRPHPERHHGTHEVYKDTRTTETRIERRPVGDEFIVE